MCCPVLGKEMQYADSGSPVTFQLTTIGLKGPLIYCPCASRQGHKSVHVLALEKYKPQRLNSLLIHGYTKAMLVQGAGT